MTEENTTLTDKIKASVMESGAFANLKPASHGDTHNSDLHELKQQAGSVIDSIQQLLDSGKLDDGASLKLGAVLAKLRGALEKGTVSREAFAAALSEAVAAMSVAEGSDKGATQQQKVEQLWQKVEAGNKDINDDFVKMRKQGVVFTDSLWNRHKELMDYLQAHPHDIKKQKELDAIDDVMMMQAESQLGRCPGAKPAVDDAKEKSKERHHVVDQALAEIDKRVSVTDAAFADSDVHAHPKNQKLTMNDVVPPSVGQKQKPAGSQLS